MAVSGYGPVHSLILWDEALTLHPKIIIEEFYAGNDLFDAYDLVYSGGQFPELKSEDPIVRSRIQSRDSLDAKANQESADSDKELWFTRRLLSKYSKLYGLLRRARHQVARIHDMRSTSQEKWEEAKIYAKNHPECCQVFDNGHARTIFTSDYRLRGLDEEDPRVREGRRISLMIMKRLHDLSVARDIRFIALLMPTKEFERKCP
jgi:hypothetical protein